LKVNMNVFKRIVPVVVGLFVLPLFAQNVKANTLDFSCVSIASCNGTITDVFSLGAFVSSSDLPSGITLVNGQGPADDQGLSFTLLFNTSILVPPAAANIVLQEQGGDNSILAGTILSATGSQIGGFDNIILTVLWTGMSGDFANFLGSPTGIGFADNIVLTVNGAAQSVDVAIAPTPEPSSLLLLGSGILSFGGLLRRRILRA
jgi:hypothetical protein